MVLIMVWLFVLPTEASEASDGGLSLSVVCIDPGHGGKDPGCVSKNKKYRESKINLDIARKLSDLIKQNYPSVKVIMTRSDDSFVTLAGRADIANKNKAGVFISLHVNSVNGTSANGFSVHVLGQSSRKDRDLYAYNMDVCKRENGVIMLEDDHSTVYQGFDPSNPESFIFFNLMQNAHLQQSLLFAQDIESALSSGPVRHSRGISQDPFLVLWKTSMPSVLVEVGFMSNPTDLAAITSEEGKTKIAKQLFKAFSDFKTRYDQSVGENIQDVQNKSHDEEKSTSGSSLRYGIQILVSSKAKKSDDAYFKNHKPLILKTGNLYKYIICDSDNLSEVKSSFAKLSKTYPGSFIVEINDGEAKSLR